MAVPRLAAAAGTPRRCASPLDLTEREVNAGSVDLQFGGYPVRTVIITEGQHLLQLGAERDLRVHSLEARMPRAQQRSKPPWDPLLVAPPHAQQPETRQDAQRDPEWPELVPLARKARRLVRAIVVRGVADCAPQTIRPLWGGSRVSPVRVVRGKRRWSRMSRVCVV